MSCEVSLYTGVPKQGGMGGIYPPQYFGFLQILGRKFRLKAKKPLKLTQMVNHPPQCWTRIGTAAYIARA